VAERSSGTERFCVECGGSTGSTRRITCGKTCHNARRRRQSRESARRRYGVRKQARPWLKPMFCLTCGVALARKPGVRTPLRCPTHQAEHERHYRTAKEQRRRFRRHGITEERYLELLTAQGGGCAICGVMTPAGGRAATWHIDHDHACCPGPWSCGQCVRGILCGRCNNLIGYADEQPAVLTAAAAYVARTASREPIPA
jgi:hypothetical protein